VQVALHLVHKEGHRVVLATHEHHQTFVQEQGLLFRPLAGDPEELSGIMVATQGAVIPTSLRSMALLFRHLKVLRDIVHSCTSAVLPDYSGLNGDGKAFVPNAIISNPPTFAHTHISEAFSLPLHLMFPQPWLPTRAWPHPLSRADMLQGWSLGNLLDYKFYDSILHLSLERLINRYRYTLGLSGQYLDCNSVSGKPFTCLYSPSLAPKPLDWNNNVDVVGYVHRDKDISISTSSSSHSRSSISITHPRLWKFLQLDPTRPPVYFGFGSMSINKDHAKHLLNCILQGAEANRVRVIVQSSKGFLAYDNNISTAETMFRSAMSEATANIHPCRPLDWSYESNDCFLLTSPISHIELFTYTAANVHHGGSGTVHTSLICGKPTWTWYFFGDQPLWGSFVKRAGAGPDPISAYKVESSIVAKGIREMFSTSMRKAATSLAIQMIRENGCVNAVDAWFRHLKISEICCQVSLLYTTPYAATLICQTCGLQMCAQVAYVVHTQSAYMGHTIVAKHDRDPQAVEKLLHVGAKIHHTGTKDDIARAEKQIRHAFTISLRAAHIFSQITQGKKYASTSDLMNYMIDSEAKKQFRHVAENYDMKSKGFVMDLSTFLQYFYTQQKEIDEDGNH